MDAVPSRKWCKPLHMVRIFPMTVHRNAETVCKIPPMVANTVIVWYQSLDRVPLLQTMLTSVYVRQQFIVIAQKFQMFSVVAQREWKALPVPPSDLATH